MKQLIFVVETNHKNQSDDRYIKRLITKRYDLSSNEIKMQFAHMCGKTNYNKPSVITQINKYLRENKDGENRIIYCFDTDRIDCEQEDVKKFKEEKTYCKNNGYDLIWFDYNIEYVLLGRNVESNKKKEESIKFYNEPKKVIPEKKLFCKNEEQKGYSNIYLVLDKLLPKK